MTTTSNNEKGRPGSGVGMKVAGRRGYPRRRAARIAGMSHLAMVVLVEEDVSWP